jgi:predicted secreted protein
MRKIVRWRITWIVLTCFMLSPSPLLATDATITVTKEQGGREIALKVGNILRIELTAKGGTGYLWFVEAAGAPCLKLMSEAAQKIGEPRPGSPVRQVWLFKAEQPGTCEINLAYCRPWEGVDKAVDHFRLKLRIE